MEEQTKERIGGFCRRDDKIISRLDAVSARIRLISLEEKIHTGHSCSKAEGSDGGAQRPS